MISPRFLAISLLALGLLPRIDASPLPETQRTRYGAVASEATECSSEAGLAMLKMGGNAVDAVSSSRWMGLGGTMLMRMRRWWLRHCASV